MLRIETERLIIRNHEEKDWEDLHAYLSLPIIYDFEPGEPVSREEAKQLVQERCRGNDFFAVVLKQSGKMVGHLYFHRTEPEKFRTWELGFIFNPLFQNKGYCTEASSAITDYAFDKWNAHKITAYCNPKNMPSWKVLEKIGMTQEGFFRKKAFFRTDASGNPLWHDCYAYGMLNPRER